MQGAETRRTTEWNFLKCLCAPNLPRDIRADCCAKLPANTFTDLAHQIIFEETRALTNASAHQDGELREHLPTRVTARGFPDVDFLDLLASRDLPPEQAHAQLRQAHQFLLNIEQN